MTTVACWRATKRAEVKDGSCLEPVFITKGGVSDDLELKPPGKRRIPLASTTQKLH
jgi:hypothetical protein